MSELVSKVAQSQMDRATNKQKLAYSFVNNYMSTGLIKNILCFPTLGNYFKFQSYSYFVLHIYVCAKSSLRLQMGMRKNKIGLSWAKIS